MSQTGGFLEEPKLAGSALLIILLILLAAAFFRVASLNLAEFKSDEASSAQALSDFVLRGRIPFLGPPLSAGGNSGPVFFYLMAIPFLVSQDPVVASIFVALLNVAGLAVTFKFVRDFFGVRVGLITSGLYAVSPFAVLFSRKIWNPDVIFPFTAVLLFCVYSFAVGKRPRYLVPAFAAYAIIVQLHPITLALSPVLLYVLVRERSQIRLRYLLLGIGAAAVVFTPFAYGALTSGTGAGGSFVAAMREVSTSRLNMAAPGLLADVTSGTGFGYVMGPAANQLYSSVFNLNQLFVLETVCLLIGIPLVLYKALAGRREERLKHSILFGWMVVPTFLLLFLNPTFGLWPHHVVMFFPVNFIVIAVVLDYALSMAKGPGHVPGGAFFSSGAKVIAIVVLALVLASQAVFCAGFLAYLGNNGGTPGDYGVGVQYKTDAMRFIAMNSNGTEFTLSSNLIPGQIGTEYGYLLGLYGKTPGTSSSLSYVVVDKLTGTNPQLARELATYPSVGFGPLTVYIVRR